MWGTDETGQEIVGNQDEERKLQTNHFDWHATDRKR
jgi:hypothetical protein